MKKLFLFCFILFFAESNAQLSIISESNVSNYPTIEFSFNNKNPEEISSSKFVFSDFVDGGKAIIDSFEVNVIDDTTDYSSENKCVIILLEKNLYLDRVEQVVTFHTALKESLSEFVNDGDLIKIVDFSLRDRNNDNKILNNVTDNFTDDVSELYNELEKMKEEIVPNTYNTKNSSELYGAIIEAIDQLNNIDTKFPKSVLVLSEERQNSRSSGTSSASVIEIAKEKNIILNTIKYNSVGFGQHNDQTLSSETYGERVVLSTSNGKKLFDEGKKDEARTAIINILNNSVERASGINYEVSLKLNNEIKDGKERKVVVEINGSNEKAIITFYSKGNWLIAFFQTNLYIALACCLVLLIIIILIILKIRKNKRRKKLEENQRINRQKQIDNEQEGEIQKQRKEIQDLKNKEEQAKKQAKFLKDEELRVQDEQKLLTQMKNQGQLPILKYLSEGDELEFTVDNPNLTVGRDAKTNRLCVPNNHISKNHFRIVFSEGKYTIIDNKSTNGIIVNGRKVERSVLKNGDIIQVANATFTFIK